MTCGGNCGPSKYSPEYYKPQKPENHAGCCGKCCDTETTTSDKKTIKKGCVIRYRPTN